MAGKGSVAIVMLLLAWAPSRAQTAYLYGGFSAPQEGAQDRQEERAIELGGGFLPGIGWIDADSAAGLLGIPAAERDTLCAAEEMAALRMPRRFDVYDARGRNGDFTAYALECTIPCNELLLHGGASPARLEGRVAQSGGGNVLPRLAAVLPAADRAAQAAVRAAQAALVKLARDSGVAARACLVTGRVRVDLDGDGREELLLCAQSRKGLGTMTSTRRTDWSGAFIRAARRGDTSRVETAVLQFERYGEEASAAPTEFRFFGCYDLNGDGRMEVLLHWQYYEGSGVAVFAEVDGRWRWVGGWGCGI